MLYPAGPMTGRPRWNFDAFEEATRALRAAGYEVWSPHERDLANGFDPDDPRAEGFDLAAAMKDDLEAVLRSDGLALLDGWEESPGAVVEVVTAEAAGIPWKPWREWLGVCAAVAVAWPLLTWLTQPEATDVVSAILVGVAP